MSIIVKRHNLGAGWINTVRDYENTMLGGIHGTYPAYNIMRSQKKDMYNFDIGDEFSNTVTFESEKDHMWFRLKWS